MEKNLTKFVRYNKVYQKFLFLNFLKKHFLKLMVTVLLYILYALLKKKNNITYQPFNKHKTFKLPRK